MKFDNQLIKAKFIKRYKRFLVDVELENGNIITVHCPNTGSMKNCLSPGWNVLLSESTNPKRKYKHTFEMIHNEKCWIAINTQLTNKIVLEAIKEKRIPELSLYQNVRTEVPYGINSKIDILLESENEKTYIEVKNSTLTEDNIYYFPDSVTKRGQKHLKELILMKSEGHRAVMFFLIQRTDGTVFRAAEHIDKEYAFLLREAYENGVEVFAYNSKITPDEICLGNRVEVII